MVNYEASSGDRSDADNGAVHGSCLVFFLFRHVFDIYSYFKAIGL